MNRTMLLIPALRGSLDEIAITQALNQARHRDLNMWEQENIPYTVRKKRQAFFSDIESQKAGKI
jgi:endonuclease YncB( thermonuclease family)